VNGTTTMKTLLATLTAATLLAASLPAFAATVVDTGTPNGSPVGALAFDSIDWAAAQVTFTQASQVDAIQGHVLGGAAGETFDVTLFADDAAQGPGTALYTATATFGSDGWNGVAGLSGWTVAAGSYWVGFEIQGDDTLGSSSVTGALLDLGAPDPLAQTATTNDGGWSYQDNGTPALSLGVRVDASAVSAVPWPSSASLMLAGLVLLSALRFGRRLR
jgi:hypothetical protein